MSNSESPFGKGTGHCPPPTAVAEKKKKNACTRIMVMDGVFAGPTLGGVVALPRYEAALRSAAASHASAEVFVAVCDGRRSRTLTTVMEPGDAQILGRHSEAGLQVEAEDVCLRHLAIVVAPSSTAQDPLVRVWDLATGRPFQTEDGADTEALTSEGACFLTLGSLHIAIIPLGLLPPQLPLGTKALWQALPERKLISRLAQGTKASAASKPMESSNRRMTRITRIPGTVSPRQAPCSPHEALGKLAVRGGGLTLRINVGAEALDRGILLGRYERCSEQFTTDRISRVHLLIARVGTTIMAIDTASTYGTEIYQVGPILAAKLSEHTFLIVANEAVVAWYPRKVDKA